MGSSGSAVRSTSTFVLSCPPTAMTYTLSLHDALPISRQSPILSAVLLQRSSRAVPDGIPRWCALRSEEHTSELQSRRELVCRLLLEKKKAYQTAGVTYAG